MNVEKFITSEINIGKLKNNTKKGNDKRERKKGKERRRKEKEKKTKTKI